LFNKIVSAKVQLFFDVAIVFQKNEKTAAKAHNRCGG
jgi:hypothetical protein